MSHREMVDWMRFEAATSPLPDRMLDLHFAIVSSLIVNAVRAADSPPATVADFLIIREPAPPDDRSAVPADGLTEADRLRALWQGG